jgi:hypothetical protein
MIDVDNMLEDVESIIRDGTNLDLDQYMNVRKVARRLIDRIGLQVQHDTLDDAARFLYSRSTT